MPGWLNSSLSLPGHVLASLVMSLAVILGGGLLLRFIGIRIQAVSPDGKGLLAHLYKALRLPLAAGIILGASRILVGTLPPGLVPNSWRIAIEMLLQFMVVIFGGELLFGFGADYYLREKRGTDIPAIFTQLIKAILYLIVGLSFLSTTYKIDITPLLTTSAVFTAVIGLALQDVLMNLFSGISVHIAPPFKIGDWIRVGGFTGKVIESNWRVTTLLTGLHELVILPNNDIAKKDIVNLSRFPGRYYVDLQIGLAYDTSPEQVRQSLREACLQVNEILKDPAPRILMEGFGDSAINYRLRYWISDLDDNALIRNKLASRIWYRLKRDGFTIPFPQREVYIHPEKDLRDHIMAHRLNLVSGVDFFSGLDRVLRAFLAESLRELVYESGEIIFAKRSTGTDFYIIDQGSVNVILDEERRFPVAVLGPGAFFGEMSLLTGAPRSATLQAATETRLLVLSRETLGRALEENQDLAKILSEAVTRRRMANLNRESEAEAEFRAGETVGGEGKECRESSSQLLERIRNFFCLR